MAIWIPLMKFCVTKDFILRERKRPDERHRDDRQT